MEKHQKCENCERAFKIVSDNPHPDYIAAAGFSVQCPFCQTPSQITSPQGWRFIVAPL